MVKFDLQKAAKEWGKAHYKDSVSQIVCADDFIAGAEWQKQQMMKDAVESEVRGYMTGVGVYVEIDIPIGIDVNEGDKVKIIIIKEE